MNLLNAVDYKVDSSGKYTYEIPVSALDTGIKVAAFSINKQSWYDCTLTFNSDTLVAINSEEEQGVVFLFTESEILCQKGSK